MILTKQLRFVQMMMFCDFNVLPCDKSHSYQVCFFFPLVLRELVLNEMR